MHTNKHPIPLPAVGDASLQTEAQDLKPPASAPAFAGDLPLAPPHSPAALAPQGEPLPCTGGRVRKLMRRMTSFYEQYLRRVGLKLGQFSLLNHLQDEGQSINQLAERLEMDRTTLTRALAPLVTNGWAEPCAGRDARERCYRLTQAGTDHRAAARLVWREAQLDLEARLGRDYVARLNLDLENTLAQLKPALPEDN